MNLPTPDQLAAERCRRRLRDFVPVVWPQVVTAPFVPGWHIDAICEHLQAVTDGEIQRLLINIPPRHGKSNIVSVLWPAWEWLSAPETKWLYASYGQNLSTRDSVACRRLIASMGLLGALPDRPLIERIGYKGLLALLGEDWELTSDQNVKTRFENSRLGYRIATSVDGGATGEGGDRIVADDPHKVKEAESDVQREAVTTWWFETMSSRVNDPKTGAFVAIMQRVHEQDLSGAVLERGGYTHLCLPAEYEPSHPFVWPDDPRVDPGEALWPDHYPPEALNELKRDMGSYASAGQLQQRPAPAEGGILKRAWWQYYNPTLLDGDEWNGLHFTRLWHSWDTALKEKTTNDFTVGTLWGQVGADAHCLRRRRGRWSLAETIEEVLGLHEWAARRFPALTPQVFVENAANGPEVISAIRRRIQGVIPVTPSVDKVTRAEAITPVLEARNVFLPGAANHDATDYDRSLTPEWAQQIIDECAAFPNGAFDDQVDSVTQALDPRRLREHGARRRGDEPKHRPITSDLSLARV